MNLEDYEAFLDSYAAAWSANDADAIASHWDVDDPAPFYKAEEVAEFFHKFEDIKAYWQHNERFHDAIRLQFSNISSKRLADALSLVFTRMRWDIRFATDAKRMDGATFVHAGKSMGGENHVVALLRDKGSELKLAGWSETPDAPISYIGQLYQWVADSDI